MADMNLTEASGHRKAQLLASAFVWKLISACSRPIRGVTVLPKGT